MTGRNFIAGSKLRVNGKSVPTTYIGSESLKASLTGFPVREPERFAISVELPDGKLSNSMELSLLPVDPEPIVKQLFPSSIHAATPFNVQPGGKSAFAVVGTNFLPGIVIEVNGKSLATSMGDPNSISAFLDDELFAKPGVLKITVRNRDGKISSPQHLTILPK